MSKLKKAIAIISVFVLMLIYLANQKVLANNNTTDSFQEVEYSDEYQKWLELSEDEQKNVIQPRMFTIQYTSTVSKNPFYFAQMLRANVNSKYSLKDVIASNLEIRNQQDTGSCWTFAALSSLETNLALTDYKNGKNANIYDFSERHMEYATSRVFLNNEINSNGYNRTVGSGGSWGLASSYLTNGTGAINESEMPFENNENMIDISNIQNKTVTSQVYDTVEFPNYNSLLLSESESSEIVNQIKSHIQNYGSVMGGIVAGGSNFLVGAKISATTGAVRVSSGAYADHAISIIGWDDNYSVNNWNEFDSDYRPKNNGAWIARNSWGENYGDNGLIYISYEDQTVSQALSGVIKSANSVDYDNIYQYDYYYPNGQDIGKKKVMLCNVYDKESSKTEYLTQVSLYVPSTYTCRVYVNASGSEKTKNDLKLVQLKAGESETLNAGYHTLELLNPIEINSDKFAVAIEISSVSDSSVIMSYIKKDSSLYSSVETQAGKCFKLDSYEYVYDDDWSGWEDYSDEGAISTIKAFTTYELIDESLKNIEITTPPTKITYFEGENFDKTGMVVKANYNSKANPSVILNNTDFSISNGTNLKAGQTSVTITYEDKSIEQPISVEKNVITELKIKTPPTKIDYKEGQNFDKTGMVVEATYKDGTTKTITDYTIEDGNNLKNEQAEVTISYDDKTVKQIITVTPNPLMEIKVTKAPNKTNYVVGQNFDKTGMVITGTFQDETTQEILDYTIENGTNLTINQSSVTIRYNDKTTTQSITVEEKTIKEISVSTVPSKINYIQNKEELDLTGGTLKITYNDGTTENISMTSEDLTVEGFDNTKIGKNTITITYQEKNVQIEIEIIAEAKAENSNFEGIKCEVKQIKAYYYKNNSSDDYTLINIELSNILRSQKNDSMEYYYYLSSNVDENNITDWIKISEEQENNDKIIFTIDSRNITNYKELAEENNVYLYLKEVAIKGGDQSIALSNSIKLETDKNVETYVDDVKKEITQLSITPSNSANNNKTEDNTSSTNKLPYAGAKVTLVILIFIIFGISSFAYIRYKNLSKYIK